MRIIGLVGAACLAAWCADTPERASAAPAAASHGAFDVLRDKTLPLLGLIERDPGARRALAADPDLASLSNAYRARLAEADRTCATDAACYVAAEKLTPTEVDRAAASLERLARDNVEVRRFADGPLKAASIVAPEASDAPTRLAAAWRGAAAMMTDMISVYGEAGPTRNPSIDAMAADPKSPAFGRLMRGVNGLMLERHPSAPAELFLAAPADAAISTMLTDNRDEAGRYEPMAQGENRLAAAAMARTDWARYPYSAIIVPGLGPAIDGQRITPGAIVRLRLALERWRAGKAPFLIVSGGHVHPNRTPFCEAIEMKRALMAEFGVPEAAILIDPHARHTTTNVRNSVRLLLAYGAPAAKKALIVSDEGQSAGIAAPTFDIRNKTETGIVPYSAKASLSRYEVEITPSRDAFAPNPTDPLDP